MIDLPHPKFSIFEWVLVDVQTGTFGDMMAIPAPVGAAVTAVAAAEGGRGAAADTHMLGVDDVDRGDAAVRRRCSLGARQRRANVVDRRAADVSRVVTAERAQAAVCEAGGL